MCLKPLNRKKGGGKTGSNSDNETTMTTNKTNCHDGNVTITGKTRAEERVERLHSHAFSLSKVNFTKEKEEEEEEEEEVKNFQFPSLHDIRSSIPRKCFEKLLVLSLYYMFRDFFMLIMLMKYQTSIVMFFSSLVSSVSSGLLGFSSLDFVTGIISSSIYNFATNIDIDIDIDIGYWIGYFVWWNLMGFFMWCLFVVGHDCGHGTFSSYQAINDICGNLCHSVLFVPYFSWQKSHYLHHCYHNHLNKDKSHVWFSEGDFHRLSEFQQLLLESPLYGFFFYTIGYLLLGIPDGSHFQPFSFSFLFSSSESSDSEKSFETTTGGKGNPATNNKTVLFETWEEKMKCIFSSFLCISWIFFIFTSENSSENAAASQSFFNLLGYMGCNYSFKIFLMNYLIPLAFFNYWLILVTYLQHHDSETLIYEEGKWDYIKGAFETIDRTYGYGIDDLHHNISNGHVIHHLFFNKIPHYHLKEATESLKMFLNHNTKTTDIGHENNESVILNDYGITSSNGNGNEKITDKSKSPAKSKSLYNGLYKHIDSYDFLLQYWKNIKLLTYTVKTKYDGVRIFAKTSSDFDNMNMNMNNKKQR